MAEKEMEEGWYWVRHQHTQEKPDSWEPAWVYPEQGYAAMTDGLFVLDYLIIGPRLSPPRSDER
jgi:hypothetical protein